MMCQLGAPCNEVGIISIIRGKDFRSLPDFGSLDPVPLLSEKTLRLPVQYTSGGSCLENLVFEIESRWSRDAIRSTSEPYIALDIPSRAWPPVWQSRTILPPSAATASSENETVRQSEQLVQGGHAAPQLEDTNECACTRKGVKVVVKKADLTAIAACPDCGDLLAFTGKTKLFQRVVCPNCGAELEVVRTEPVELEWAYEDYDG